MRITRNKMLAGAAALALAAGGTGVALATGGAGGSDTAEQESGPDDGDGQPVTGSSLDQASAVALRETNGGRVTDSELDDEEGYYEIEVTKQDGSQADVHLDRQFNVINAQSDGGADD